MDSIHIIVHDSQVLSTGPGGHVLDFCGVHIGDAVPEGRIEFVGDGWRLIYHLNLTRPWQVSRAEIHTLAEDHCGGLVYDSAAALLAAWPWLAGHDEHTDPQTGQIINVPRFMGVAEG